MADIDSLKFSIILDDSKFTQKMKDVEGLAEKFEDSVRKALAITNALNNAQSKGSGAEEKKVKTAEKKNQKQKELLKMTREELELKKAQAGLSNQELARLNALIRHDKALTQEEKNRLDLRKKQLEVEKKQLDIENKTLTIEKKKEEAERRHAAAVETTNTKVKTQSAILRQISSYLGTYLSVFGGIRLIQSIVRITGEFEAQRVALRAILQDAAGADRIFYQLQELAVKSPYTFRDLTTYAKQLSAFSVPMNEIYDTTKKLADVSAGLGVDMSRIILAFGQIRSAAFLRGQEVRQLTESGIPILAELAEQFEEIEGHAVSTGEVFDRISKRQVPFEMVEEAFRRMTSEGGKFYNMQEVLAETVKGKVSNLTDAWEIMLSKVGDANSGLIKGSINLLTELIKNYEKLGKVILEVTVAYGSYKAVLASTNALQAAGAVSTRFLAMTGGQVTKLEVVLHSLFRTTNSGLTKIGNFIAKNPYAIAIAIAATAITALIFRISEMNKHLRETDKITSKAIAQAEASKSNIHYYIEEMKKAEVGTEEYNKARQAVIDNSGKFISATDAERLSLENVDDVWVNICNHIEEATKLQAMRSVTAEASAKKQESQLRTMDEISSYQRRNNISREEFNYLVAYTRGEKSDEETYEKFANRRGTLYFKALEWKADYEKAERVYDEMMARARQNIDALYGTGDRPEPKAEEPLEGWRKKVEDYINAFGGGDRGMKVDKSTDLASYIKKGAEALNDARDALKHIPQDDADYEAIKKNVEFYEGLSEAIYGPGKTEFDNITKKIKEGAKDAKTLHKEQIDSIQQEVQNLKELKAAYDKFKELKFNDDEINKLFVRFFGVGVPAGGFGGAFEGLAARAEGLGESNMAQDIRNYYIGKDWKEYAAGIDSAQKATKKFQEALKDLEASTKRLNLEGFAADLDKIIVDADSRNRKLRTDWDQQERELEAAKDGWINDYRVKNEKATAEEAERAWKDYFNAQKAMAKESIDTQIDYNNKVAQRQIDKKADEWVREMLERNNINLNDMGDKSLAQVNMLIERLRSLVSDEGLSRIIPDDLAKDAELINVSFKTLLSNVRKIANTKLGDLRVEQMKKTVSGVKSIMSAVGINTDTSAVSESYAILSQRLTEVANAQEDVNKAQEEFDAAKNSGDINKYAAANITLVAAQNKLKVATEGATQAQNEFNAVLAMSAVGAFASVLGKAGDAIKRMGEAADDADLTGVGDAFSRIAQNMNAAAAGFAAVASTGAVAYAWIGAVVGGVTDLLGQIFTAVEEHQQMMMELENHLRDYKVAVRASLLEMTEFTDMFGEQIARSGREAFDKIITAAARVRDTYNQLKKSSVMKDHKSWLEGGNSYTELLTAMYPGLFTWDGHINTDLASKIINEMPTGGKSRDWNAELRDLLQEAVDAEEAWKKAKDALDSYITSFTGDWASSLADVMWNAVASGEDAWKEWHKVASDAIADIGKQMLTEMIQSAWLGKYEKELENAFSSNNSIADVWKNVAEIADRMFRDVDSNYGYYLQVTKEWQDKMLEAGYTLNGESSDSNNLAPGIKGVTEDTANLIASYLNAIRADVSYGRVQRERIAVAVEGQVGSYITLSEYLAQVEANTANIARSNADILLELRGVIINEGAGRGFRSYPS